MEATAKTVLEQGDDSTAVSTKESSIHERLVDDILSDKKSAITLDINIGDTLLGGRFKNVKTVVKKIGKDDNNQPTINGKKLLSFRIAKQMPGYEKPSVKDKSDKKARGFLLSNLAPKWNSRDHIIAALEQHLQDAQAAIGTDNENKEFADLALITEAYRRNFVSRELMKQRYAKFGQFANAPSLASKTEYLDKAAASNDSPNNTPGVAGI